MRLRVVVYNIRGFRDGLGNVAELVAGYEPDVLLLNETGRRGQLRRLARTLGMEVAADPRAYLQRRVKNAVLARTPWRIIEHRLHRFERSERFYPRGALMAHLGRSGFRVWALAVHLGLSPAERRRHVQELTDRAAGLPGAVLIGGDLNELADRRAAAWMGERYWDVWLLGGDASGETFPASDPTARIDFLFVSEGIRVERAIVAGSPLAASASDHRPVVAELSLPEPRAT